MDDNAIEQQIQAKGLTAPRLKPSDIESAIAETHFFTAGDGVRGAAVADGVDDGSTPLLDHVTFCTLVLRNGARVVGINYGSISPENFDSELAQKLARDAAVEKIWELEGYLFRDQLYRRALFDASPKIGYGTQSAGAAVLIQRDPPHIEAQPPVDNAHVAPGAEQFSAADIASAVRFCAAKAYLVSPDTFLPFGAAMLLVKRGAKIARAGWNGKGMFVYLVPAASYPVQTGAAKSHFGEGSMVPYNAYLALKGVDETVSTWAPSCSDALADDWQLVE
jgi:hypothetical protein